MIFALIFFILPLLGYGIFYYLIIKSARRDVLLWREQVRKEITSPLQEAIADLQRSKETFERLVATTQEESKPVAEPFLSPQLIPSYNFAEYSPKKPKYPVERLSLLVALR